MWPNSLAQWVECLPMVRRPGFNPRSSHTKDFFKMVLDTSLLNTQLYKVRIKGKEGQSRERSNALPYTYEHIYKKCVYKCTMNACLDGRGSRIHRLHLCRWVRLLSQRVSCYDTKLSDGEVPVPELWGIWSTPSLPLLPGPLWPGVVTPNRILSLGQIELLDHLNCIKTNNLI